MSRLVLGPLVLAGCLAAGAASAAPVISAGDHTLRAEQADQVIDILVTGGDLADGLDFYLSVDDGLGSGGAGPVITGLEFSTPGTIFYGSNLLYETAGDLDTCDAWGGLAIAFGEPSVAADGILARATLDTSGVAADEYPLQLEFSDAMKTALIDAGGDFIADTVLEAGSLIVPPRLEWNGGAEPGEWQEAKWDDGQGSVVPGEGGDMVVQTGWVNVDGQYTSGSGSAAAWLDVSGDAADAGTVHVLDGSTLEATESVFVSGEGTLAVDGTLTAADVVTSGGTLSGSGTLTAGSVVIGGVLSPGGLAGGTTAGALTIEGDFSTAPATATGALGGAETLGSVPEPGSWLLLLTAGLTIAALARRVRA